MNLLQALLLGALQGVIEWLPISSSGQGMLVMFNLMGIDQLKALSLSFFLHLGSLLAVVIYFRNDIKEIYTSIRAKRWKGSYLEFLVISTLATAVVGIPIYLKLRSLLESMGNQVNILIGVGLIVTGLFLRSSDETGSKSVAESNLSDMLLVGFAQGIAVVPGISRSGATIALLLFRRFDQREALKISFLMAIPAILGANFLGLFGGELSGVAPSNLIAGVIFSLAASLVGIRFLLDVSRKLRFDSFCLFFGAIAVLFGLALF
ncbi:MAG: undecaprenyl-diphosphate phosphatase [Candidatus Hydrothermarchaeales archaeon]